MRSRKDSFFEWGDIYFTFLGSSIFGRTTSLRLDWLLFPIRSIVPQICPLLDGLSSIAAAALIVQSVRMIGRGGHKVRCCDASDGCGFWMVIYCLEAAAAAALVVLVHRGGVVCTKYVLRRLFANPTRVCHSYHSKE